MSAAQASSVFAAEGTKYGKDPVAAYYALSETPWVTQINGTADQIGTTPTPGIGPDVTLALLPPSPAPTAGTYANPTVTVDGLGRVTTITDNADIILTGSVAGTANNTRVTNLYNQFGQTTTCSAAAGGAPVVFGGWSPNALFPGDGNGNLMYLIGINPTTYSAANATYINNNPAPVLKAGFVYLVQFGFVNFLSHASGVTDAGGVGGINLYAVAALPDETIAVTGVPLSAQGNSTCETTTVFDNLGPPAGWVTTQRGIFSATIVGQGLPLRIGVSSASNYSEDPTDINTAAVWLNVTTQIGSQYYNDSNINVIPTKAHPVVIECIGPYISPT